MLVISVFEAALSGHQCSIVPDVKKDPLKKRGTCSFYVVVVVESYEGCVSACFLMHHCEKVFKTGFAARKCMWMRRVLGYTCAFSLPSELSAVISVYISFNSFFILLS